MGKAAVEQIRFNHLRKQFFLQEESLDFFNIAKTHLGLHSTDYWSPYISVFARIGDYDAAQVYDALNHGDQLARIHAFHRALHVVHRENLALITSATGPSLYKDARRVPFLREKSDQQVEEALSRILAVLEKQPMTMREIKKAIPNLGKAARWILLLGMAQGKIIRAQTAHARSPLCTYAILDRWMGMDFRLLPGEKAVDQLIRRYLDIFGPASVNDIAWWLPTTKSIAKSILKDWEDELHTLEIQGTTKFMLADDFEMAASLEPTKEPIISFLPYEDYFPKGFKDRSWYINPDIQARLFPRSAQFSWPKGATPKRAMPDTGTSGVNQSGEIRPSIWYNGEIIGRWEFVEKQDNIQIVYDIYWSLPKKQQVLIDEQHRRVEEFVNNRLLPISKAK